MSEGLEALNKINSGAVAVLTPYDGWQDENIRVYYAEEFNIVENELKEYEQYKAIEKEFGIDLVTLFKAFKALKNGFYDENKEYHHFSNLFIDSIEIFDSYEKVSFYLKDYGKTWALTKEELE